MHILMKTKLINIFHRPNKGKEKRYSNVELILTTGALLRTFGVNKHTKFIHVIFRGKCHTTNRDCEHRKPRIVLVIFERVSLDFFFFFFFFFFFLSILMNFYDVILSTFLHSNWITLKMSERLRQGGSRERGLIKSSHIKVGK